ncbi:ferrochelatase [Kangiella sp. TOML190]|uniref:ferrochelatase n=1 Tax=Kangiella sp. TOML190 TaxID=2931351 RepID=UPI00203A668E|nr:ferrochelatase [Kangiella sp. TOML190]
MSKKQGVLLCNLGTPDVPSAEAVRKYLGQFLHDKRVVSIPRIIWCPILHGIILRTRPQKVAKLYQSIWTDNGSPLMVHSQAQRRELQIRLDALASESHTPIELAMCYGNPSIPKALESLEAQGCERIIVLPLYPQYSSATNAAIFDQVSKFYKKRFFVPELSYVNGYHNHPLYIKGLVDSVKAYWQEHGQAKKLLFSYHGVPERFSKKGDPYEAQCHETTRLVVEQLGLEQDQYQIAFQSRFGREEWVKPYTEATLQDWGKAGLESVQIISPAFASDCLETLEELAIQNKEVFVETGGGDYSYIPALNDSPIHIDLLYDLLQTQLH